MYAGDVSRNYLARKAGKSVTLYFFLGEFDGQQLKSHIQEYNTEGSMSYLERVPRTSLTSSQLTITRLSSRGEF